MPIGKAQPPIIRIMITLSIFGSSDGNIGSVPEANRIAMQPKQVSTHKWSSMSSETANRPIEMNNSSPSLLITWSSSPKSGMQIENKKWQTDRLCVYEGIHTDCTNFACVDFLRGFCVESGKRQTASGASPQRSRRTILQSIENTRFDTSTQLHSPLKMTRDTFQTWDMYHSVFYSDSNLVTHAILTRVLYRTNTEIIVRQKDQLQKYTGYRRNPFCSKVRNSAFPILSQGIIVISKDGLE